MNYIIENNFQKHPDDEYDASKVKQVEFRCYACPQGFYDYGSLEKHFIQKHSEENLDPEKVYLGNTQVTAAKFKHRKNKRQNIHEQTTKRTKVDDNNQQITKKLKAFQCMFCPNVFRKKWSVTIHCKKVYGLS